MTPSSRLLLPDLPLRLPVPANTLTDAPRVAILGSIRIIHSAHDLTILARPVGMLSGRFTNVAPYQ